MYTLLDMPLKKILHQYYSIESYKQQVESGTFDCFSGGNLKKYVELYDRGIPSERGPSKTPDRK